jgi:hypothetical protein
VLTDEITEENIVGHRAGPHHLKMRDGSNWPCLRCGGCHEEGERGHLSLYSAETAAEEEPDFERISVDAWGLAGRVDDASDLRLTPSPTMKDILKRQ